MAPAGVLAIQVVKTAHAAYQPRPGEKRALPRPGRSTNFKHVINRHLHSRHETVSSMRHADDR